MSAASATNRDDEDNIANAEANTSADASSYSESAAGAESASSSGASSDNSVVFNSSRPSDTTVRNVASPDTPNVYPSAPCRIAKSGGLSLAGGAISGGSSVEDVECTLRETARTFQYLGVPEVGLHLLCTQSVVINGRKDKQGELQEGEPAPIGAAECLRLVREFQGDADDGVAGRALQTEVEVLREQQDRFERELIAQVGKLEQRLEQDENKPVPAPTVTRQTVQQEYLTADKRARLAEAILDNEETEEN